MLAITFFFLFLLYDCFLSPQHERTESFRGENIDAWRLRDIEFAQGHTANGGRDKKGNYA